MRAAFHSQALRAMAGRLSWGLADQAVSSMTNFAVSIVVARTLGAVEFGIFTLAWVTYGVVLNISRGLATDPLTVRFSGVPRADWRQAVPRSCGTAIGVGATAGVLSIAAGTAIGGSLGSAFIALGLILPALLWQDSWRFAFFAAGEGRRAFTNDMVWAGALIPALMLAASTGSVFGFLLAWGGAAAVAAMFGWAQTGLMPHAGGVGPWLRQQRDLGPRYLVENVSISGAVQVRMYGLGAIAGLADVGAVRGADLLLGPFIAVTMGLALVAVPEASRVLRSHPRRLRLFCLGLGGLQVGGALMWGLGLLVLLPNELGLGLLGEVWPAASVLLIPATLAVAGVGLSNGATAGLRALGAARRSLRCQLAAAAGLITGGLLGAAIADASGSAWGVAIAAWCAAIFWWTQLHAGLRDHSRRTMAPGGSPVATTIGNEGVNT
ncbi:MATE family efflux transporter [Haloechinothrix halophila]|uniref:hypothetical protein n=1 Tax=Haloechinothrix halophila TaxID=1069073 RepID=UPI001E323B48|nr:hypothetical protein [Haloechinothrix halophila]